jgi:hypothetical protein
VSKKPKPATVGERIAFSPVLPETVGGVARLNLARRIDAAIGRAVKAERERCALWARYVEYGSRSIGEAVDAIESGKEHGE